MPTIGKPGDNVTSCSGCLRLWDGREPDGNVSVRSLRLAARGFCDRNVDLWRILTTNQFI